ncbi:hypothetical protein KY284_015360 [Solanum tuberosum]|nr:hypothetical protein KY284_015360 [Solanum tuberosum]
MAMTIQKWLLIILFLHIHVLNIVAQLRNLNILNTLLTSLPSKIDNYGFYKASIGQNSDRASVIVLCRGDVELQECRHCVYNVSQKLVQVCPNKKEASGGYDKCMLLYSNESITDTTTFSKLFYLKETQNASKPDEFNKELGKLLVRLRVVAAHGDPRRKYASGNATGPDFQTIFALVQCTPDLPPQNCFDCLTKAYEDMGKKGGRIIGARCNFRYGTSRFFRLDVGSSVAPPPEGEGGDDKTVRTVIIIVVPTVTSVILIGCISVILMRRRKKKLVDEIQSIRGDDISTTESLQYDFSTIRAATNNFSDANMLGQGGFGPVYKGKLQNGKEIAVKRLSADSGQDSVKRTQLDWERRSTIIRSVARGILYLHEDSRLRIIHRDLKASNVLLDEKMYPKISDFGMARLFKLGETQGNTSRIVGTYGYMAPEYAMHGQFTVKSDVLSFGVLVLEILSGQKNTCFRNGEYMEYLLSYAWRNWREGTAINLIDPILTGSSGLVPDIMRCIHIALLCVQENIGDRPTIAAVVLMLSSLSLSLPVPSGPAYYTHDDIIPEISLIQDHQNLEN